MVFVAFVAILLGVGVFPTVDACYLSGPGEGWEPFPESARKYAAYDYAKAFFTPMNFFEAQANCLEHDAHVAYFRDEDEFNFLKGLCNRSDCWFGLYHFGERVMGSYPFYRLYFTDGRTTYYFTSKAEHESLWGKYATRQWSGASMPAWEARSTNAKRFAYEPNNRGGNENCACVAFNDYYYVNGDRLNDWNCRERKPAHVCVFSYNLDTVALPFHDATEFYRMRDKAQRRKKEDDCGHYGCE